MAASKRTTMHSRSGTKLYAERDSNGRFKDIQTYGRAHGQDVKRVSKAEASARAAAGEPARKKSVASGAPARKTSGTARKPSGTARKSAGATRKTSAGRKSAASRTSSVSRKTAAKK